MNINYAQNSNNTSFSANFAIKKTKAFKSPSKNFDEWITRNIDQWERKAHLIGSDKDKITITLGKNNTDVSRGGIFKKQNMTATAEVNGIEIKSNDLNFEYPKIGSTSDRYLQSLKEIIDDYLNFIERVGNCKIVKKNH